MKSIEENNHLNIKEEEINIREEIQKYSYYWRFFIFGGLISLFLGFVYLRYTTPTYAVDATIMIKDNKQSGISTELAAFEDLGILGGGAANNPENEIEIIKSRKIVGRVIDSLNLGLSYFREGRIREVELYGKTNPIIFDLMLKERDTSFVISILDNKNYKILNSDKELVSNHLFGDIVKTEFGAFRVNLNQFFNDLVDKKEVRIAINSRNVLIDYYLKKMDISAIEDLSPVIKLKINTSVREKGEDFLNELITQYNLDGINDENLVSQKTMSFIDSRLVAIGKSLKIVEDDVKNYKVDNNITGLSSEAELTLEVFSESTQDLVKIKTELELANWVKQSLNNSLNQDETLPQNLGFSDAAIASSIQNYNILVLEKNRLAANAGKKNPLLRQYIIQINAVRASLEKSISNLIISLEIKFNQIRTESLKLNTKIASLPYLERQFIDIAREQEIIAGLYSYLLKKREETSISLAITVPNAKIIDVAYGASVPIAPNKKLILLASLFIGLILPFVFIYLKNLLDTKIHSRKNIEELTTIPFLGDIPHSETGSKVVIDNESRTSTAEAFRLIRTNLDFILAKSKNDLGKIIFVTSTSSGEGKVFRLN